MIEKTPEEKEIERLTEEVERIGWEIFDIIEAEASPQDGEPCNIDDLEDLTEKERKELKEQEREEIKERNAKRGGLENEQAEAKEELKKAKEKYSKCNY